MQTLTLRQGDSSDFFYSITLNLKSSTDEDLDLTGWTAIFQVSNHEEKFTNITDNEIEIIIPASSTRLMPVGTHKAYLKLITDDLKVGTIKQVFNLNVLSETVREFIA